MELVYSFDLYMLISTLIAVSLQVYLFVVVIIVSPKSMSQYRYFLCLFIFWDCFYNISVGLLVMPEMCSPATGAIVHGFGQDLVKLFGFNVNRVLLGMIFWGGADILQLQLYCLMYRFCAIHPNEKVLEWFMSWTGLAIFHVLGYLVTFSVSIPAYLAAADQETALKLMSKFPDAVIQNLTDKTNVIFVDTNAPLFQVVSFYALFMFVVCIAAGSAMSVHIIKYLKKHAAVFTEKTYKMHLQLTTILVIQQITPILFVILPLSAVGYMNLVGKADKISATAFNIGIALLTIYPSTNCLICLYFCSPYYNFTKKWIHYVLYRMHIVKRKIDTNTVALPQTSVSVVEIKVT